MNKLTTTCDKHGDNVPALPIINGTIPPRDKWPKKVTHLPLVCAKCLAEAMLNPIRRRAV